MEKETAERIAWELIDKYLGDEGWDFRWDNAKMRMGACFYHIRVISASLPFALAGDEATFRDTILHEVAHAVAGPGAGHGVVWRAIARKIGATPHATANETNAPNLRAQSAPWVGVCPAGHELSKRYFRKPRTRRSCSVCSPRGFSTDHLFTFHRIDATAGVR